MTAEVKISFGLWSKVYLEWEREYNILYKTPNGLLLEAYGLERIPPTRKGENFKIVNEEKFMFFKLKYE